LARLSVDVMDRTTKGERQRTRSLVKITNCPTGC
jgi:hypothetical protein